LHGQLKDIVILKQLTYMTCFGHVFCIIKRYSQHQNFIYLSFKYFKNLS